MKKIIFRGVDSFTDQWVFGLFSRTIPAGFPCITTYEFRGIAQIIRVIPDTVGQFIGITDKNNKQVFEGDIGKHEKFGIVRVAFLEQECAYVYVSKKLDYRIGHRATGCGYNNDQQFEVIGNIYDNPEMLTE